MFGRSALLDLQALRRRTVDRGLGVDRQLPRSCLQVREDVTGRLDEHLLQREAASTSPPMVGTRAALAVAVQGDRGHGTRDPVRVNAVEGSVAARGHRRDEVRRRAEARALDKLTRMGLRWHVLRDCGPDARVL